MRAVYCPFCDNVQNQVGFRPMTFFCENCGSEGDWWNGREIGIDRGLIAWSITDDTMRYYADILMDAFQIVEELFKQFEGLAEAFIAQVRIVNALIQQRAIEESEKLEPDSGVYEILNQLLAELRELVKAVAEYVQLVTEQANDDTDMVIEYVENTLYQLMVEHQQDLSGEDAGDVMGSGAEILIYAINSGANQVAWIYTTANGMMVTFISMVAEIASQIPD